MKLGKFPTSAKQEPPKVRSLWSSSQTYPLKGFIQNVFHSKNQKLYLPVPYQTSSSFTPLVTPEQMQNSELKMGHRVMQTSVTIQNKSCGLLFTFSYHFTYLLQECNIQMDKCIDKFVEEECVICGTPSMALQPGGLSLPLPRLFVTLNNLCLLVLINRGRRAREKGEQSYSKLGHVDMRSFNMCSYTFQPIKLAFTK